MAKLPLSASTSYATPDDLVDYHDFRRMAQYAVDNDAPLTESAFKLDARTQKMLNWGAGIIESACHARGIYTREDLAALDGVSKELLVGMNADLAFYKFVRRRHGHKEALDVSNSEETWEMLEALREGALIFSFSETTDAGVMAARFEKRSEVEARCMSSFHARRLFGIRGNRDCERRTND